MGGCSMRARTSGRRSGPEADNKNRIGCQSKTETQRLWAPVSSLQQKNTAYRGPPGFAGKRTPEEKKKASLSFLVIEQEVWGTLWLRHAVLVCCLRQRWTNDLSTRRRSTPSLTGRAFLWLNTFSLHQPSILSGETVKMLVFDMCRVPDVAVCCE
jgi:hypothetical protein